MCGIYGFVGRTEQLGPTDQIGRLLSQMDAALVHRGPDENGTYFDGRCAFGMRRLSIIDLGGGHQPIANEDRSIWVVFNGEIYNHAALQRQLEARGHQFSTRSDTECLVHLYEDRGEAMLDALDGMFAFAIWDRNTESLFIGRDRLGIKPLYFAETPRGLLFASEMKALLPEPSIARALSSRALSHYLSFGVTPGDEAIFDGIRKLPPAHKLRYRRGAVSIARWWSLSPAPRNLSDDDAVDEVRALLFDAVRSHLVSDVPVGAFLSGGVDSATVVAQMVALGARPKTFSIGFEHRDFDELRWARVIASRFGTDHHELVVRPDAWALAGDLAWSLDEPFADVSALPTYLVSQLAAQHVKVVLSGDGGDEVFAGYDRYPQALAEARRFDWLPSLARGALGIGAALLPDAARGKHWLRHASLDRRVRFLDGEALFPGDLKRRLLGPALRPLLREEPSPVEERARSLAESPGDALGKLLHHDATHYLPLDILTKVDRMTMACSLEARPPLLDHHLVEAVFSLPSTLKLRGSVQKYLLKRAARYLVPEAILKRKKRGFGVPIRHWFRGPLRDQVLSLLGDSKTRARGLFEPRFVQLLAAEHLSGRRDHSLRLWALMMLELWCRRYADGRVNWFNHSRNWFNHSSEKEAHA